MSCDMKTGSSLTNSDPSSIRSIRTSSYQLSNISIKFLSDLLFNVLIYFHFQVSTDPIKKQRPQNKKVRAMKI